MTTLTETAPLDVDLDAQVPCRTMVTRCPAEATWEVRHPCCGTTNTLCAPHRFQAERRWDQIDAEHGRVICGACLADPMPKPTWRPL